MIQQHSDASLEITPSFSFPHMRRHSYVSPFSSQTNNLLTFPLKALSQLLQYVFIELYRWLSVMLWMQRNQFH